MAETKLQSSITKEEINLLPVIKFEGKIVVVSNHDQLKLAAQNLNKEKLLGFDTEHLPNFQKGRNNFISLLQLATDNEAYLFRLNKIGFHEELINILTNKEIIKVGAAIHDDLKGLQRFKRFEPQGFKDLNTLAGELKLKNAGLRSLAGIILKSRITKTAKLTNWEAETLTAQQLSYAATDAWIAIKIYEGIKEITG